MPTPLPMDSVAGAAPAAPAAPVQSRDDRPVLAAIDGGRQQPAGTARHDDREALKAQLETAHDAIEHVLNRIHKSPEVGYYMGYGTESFERLCVAYSEMHGELAEATKERFHPLHPRDPTKALAEEIEKLHERLSGKSGHSCHDDEEPEHGPENLHASDYMERVRELLGQYSTNPERCVREIAALYDAQQLPINLVISAL